MTSSRAPGVLNIAKTAEDRLWERQIRREHHELANRVGGLAEKRDRDIEALQQQCEATAEVANTALTRLEKLEHACTDRNREIDEHIEELKQYLYRTVEKLRRRFSDEELGDIMPDKLIGRQSSSFLHALHPEDEPLHSVESPVPSLPTRPPPRAANRKSSYIPHEPSPRQSTSKSTVMNQQIGKPSNRALASDDPFKKPSIPAGSAFSYSPTNNRKRSIATRPTDAGPSRPPPMMTRNRSRTKSRESAAQAQPAPSAPGPAKVPRLSQSRRPLMAYYKEATAIHASLGLEVGTLEYAFISAFIAGISSKQVADELVDSLANFCASVTKEDGSKEIFCDWDEVLEGIKNAGLDAVEHGCQDNGKATAGMPSASTSAAEILGTSNVGNAYTAEDSSATGSRSKKYHAADRPVTGKERFEQGSERSSSRVVDMSGMSYARPGAASETSGPRKSQSVGLSVGKGKEIATHTSVGKPGPDQSRQHEKPRGGNSSNSRSEQITVEKPGLINGRSSENSFGITGLSSGRGGVEGGAGGRASIGGRRGYPRAAKR